MVTTESDGSSSTIVSEEQRQFKIYKRRWLMLFIVFFLNVSNGAIWISFATITNSAGAYFKVSNSSVDWFSLVFFITTIPFMFIAMWVMDKLGFKVGVLIGCFLNFTGSLVRIIGTLDIPLHMQYPIVLTGQTIASLAQPFAMSLPTKVSEVWFAEDQRTFSTALCAMGNPLGFMVGSLISPLIVVDYSDVPVMNDVIGAIGMAAGVLGILVRESKPPLPPSRTADKPDIAEDHSYLQSLKLMAMNKDFMVLMFAVGGGMGLVSALQTMMEQMLCPWGYEDGFAGICCAVMVLGGFVGAGVFSFIAEKTKHFEEIINIGYAATVLICIVFMLINHIRNIGYAIAILSGIMGFLAVGIYPVCLEAGVEVTYPVDETVSAGLIVVAGQVLGTVFVLVMEALVQPLSYDQKKYEKCSSGSNTEAENMIYSGIFLVAVASVLSVLMLILFRPKYKRMEAEKMKNISPATSVPSDISQTPQSND